MSRVWSRRDSERSRKVKTLDSRLRGNDGTRRLRQTLGTSDAGVGLGAAVAEELPGVADVGDEVEVEVRDEHFVFVARGLGDDLAARVAEIGLTVELADVPRGFCANAI